jgi:hypothetical protein
MKRAMLALGAFALIAAIVVFVVERSSARNTAISPSEAVGKRTAAETVASAAVMQPMIIESARAAAPPATVSTEIATISPRTLSTYDDMRALLHDARRTTNIEAQEFAVHAPANLCLALLLSRNAGVMPLVEARRDRVAMSPAQLKQKSSPMFERTGAGCLGFQQETQLRDDLVRELARLGAPVASVDKVRFGEGFPDAESRLRALPAAIDRVLQNEDPASGAYLTRLSLSHLVTQSLAGDLPDWLKDETTNLALIGVDIGLCRAGLACGQNTIPLSHVCVWFGECSSVNVEAAYRSLHAMYDVPFDYVNRVAERVEAAVKARQSSLLQRR